ncbi:unnamed protein product [Ilex paraguariensis]|uniref:BHLH domain-containing protein n=1 Tax=Ilex paraguariensis TaxID=185542 RepID=A0ABC8TUE7_9AQUA
MDYVSSMFPFEQMDELELFLNASILPPKNTIKQDKFLNASSLQNSDLTKKPDYTRRRKSFDTVDDIDDEFNDHMQKKKIKHRDIERQRRKEMTGHYRALGSLIPPVYLEGKRSVSDHMNAAVSYIKHRQKRIEELNQKRDELKEELNPNTPKITCEGSQVCRRDCVTVNTCRAGMEAVVNTAMRGGLPLSRVLSVLMEEGLTTVSCISTKVNERLIHTIESEVEEEKSINPSELQQKLTDLAT